MTARRSELRLRQLLERAVQETLSPIRSGLLLSVDHVVVRGRPPERIEAWATLHFLESGSPYCCVEPRCHLPLPEAIPAVAESVRCALRLRSTVEIEFVRIGSFSHRGAQDLSHAVWARQQTR